MLKAGAEILLETSRFWASRVELESDGRYHIRGVIGPDEYHEGVDDNAYTNVMAAFNIELGLEVVNYFSGGGPPTGRPWARSFRFLRKRRPSGERYGRSSSQASTPAPVFFEQFAGFFRLEDID